MSKYSFSHKDMVEDWNISIQIPIKYKWSDDKGQI